MGTSYTVKMSERPPTVVPQTLERRILQVLDRVDRWMSTYRNDSELSRYNHNPSTDWVAVSPELAVVLEEAQTISRLSDGAFDVTVGPLLRLWGFGPHAQDPPRVPSPNEIEQAKNTIGYRRLKVRRVPPAIKKTHPKVSVDLSAIAPGYAVDLIAALLEDHGVHDYLVDIGGEERVKGRSPRGARWRIAIARPLEGEGGILRTLELESGAVATSGDYRNYFERDGQRYSHLLDPRAGRPIKHRLASVTVIAETAMRADALATALMVLGPEQGMELAEEAGLAALFIVRGPGGYIEQLTHGFARLIKTTQPNPK